MPYTIKFNDKITVDSSSGIHNTTGYAFNFVDNDGNAYTKIINYENAGLDHALFYSTTATEVYSESRGSGSWSNNKYKTIVCESLPSGALYTWLENNSTITETENNVIKFNSSGFAVAGSTDNLATFFSDKGISADDNLKNESLQGHKIRSNYKRNSNNDYLLKAYTAEDKSIFYTEYNKSYFGTDIFWGQGDNIINECFKGGGNLMPLVHKKDAPVPYAPSNYYTEHMPYKSAKIIEARLNHMSSVILKYQNNVSYYTILATNEDWERTPEQATWTKITDSPGFYFILVAQGGSGARRGSLINAGAGGGGGGGSLIGYIDLKAIQKKFNEYNSSYAYFMRILLCCETSIYIDGISMALGNGIDFFESTRPGVDTFKDMKEHTSDFIYGTQCGGSTSSDAGGAGGVVCKASLSSGTYSALAKAIQKSIVNISGFKGGDGGSGFKGTTERGREGGKFRTSEAIGLDFLVTRPNEATADYSGYGYGGNGFLQSGDSSGGGGGASLLSYRKSETTSTVSGYGGGSAGSNHGYDLANPGAAAFVILDTK